MSTLRPSPERSSTLEASWNRIVSAGAAGVICFGLAAIGFGIAITGPELTSNVPFLPHEVNQAVGRLFIGFGAVLTTGIGIYAFRDCARLFSQRVGERRGDRGSAAP